MAPPTEAFALSSAPPQEDPAPVSTIAVRSDHWDAITKFITAQSIVLNAAVPRPLHRLHGHAHEQHKALDPILNKYKFADDMAEVTVTLDNGEQQKVRISQEAVSTGIKLGEASKDNDIIKTEVCNLVS